MYCVFYAIKFAHFAHFSRSLVLLLFPLPISWICYIREHIIVGWLSAILSSQLFGSLSPFWLEWKFIEPHEFIMWKWFEYGGFFPFMCCNRRTHSFSHFLFPNVCTFEFRGIRRCLNRKIKFNRNDRWIIQVLYSNYMYSHYVAWLSHSQYSAECKMHYY